MIAFAIVFPSLVTGRNSLVAVWRKVMIDPPSKQDLLDVILEWYPELEPLALKLIGLQNISDLYNSFTHLMIIIAYIF